MNILITGANGLLGTELISQMINKNSFNLYAITSKKQLLLDKFENKFKIFSLEEFYDNKVPFKKIDIVIHCAFARAEKGAKEIAKSMLFTTELFNDLSKLKYISIINISSQEVYGNSPCIWTETDDVHPNTNYGLAKYFSELYLYNKFYNSESSFTSMRLAGLVGNGADYRSVTKLINQAIDKKEIKIISSIVLLSQIDTRDATAGIIALLNIPAKKWKNIYNLGYIKSYTLEEIAETIKKVGIDYGIDVNIQREPSRTKIIAELDSTLFYNDTNWSPKYNIEATIRDIFEAKWKN